ncbi:hypothetical protein HGP14_35075, partial [Rhizobium sp. P32RR-XVIII]|uniref:fibronectin type III domain-containing protein n=1 Tax=Rhizobium sp. P32RR-XVIII TaxID=2726738 RepID=UPI0017CFEC5E
TTPATSALTVSWLAPDVGHVTGYIVRYAPKGTGNWFPSLTVSSPQTDLRNLDPGAYDVWVRAIFDNGQLSDWLKGVLSASIFAGYPGAVPSFTIAVAGDSATLQWGAATPAEIISHYEIRHSSALTGVTWQTANILRIASGTQVQVPAIRGTFLIKAVSYAGLQSKLETIIINAVDPLTKLNAVEALEEEPPFPGMKNGTYFDGSALRLGGASDLFALDDWFEVGDFFLGTDGYLTEGHYDFVDTVDLGAVYTSRVSSQIEALGERSSDDVFGLVNFFERDDFFGDIGGLWSVTVEVSTTDDDPGGSPVWTDWAPLVTGDISARAYRFRAKMASFQQDVTPLVTSLAVTVDMPDRVIAGNDIVVSGAGLTIPFTPAFRSLQGLSIAAQGLATGDYYEITAKDETGFHIAFKNAGGSAITRTLDYVAKGHGSIQ